MKRFTPPTEAEVAAYVAEKGYHVDAGEFVSFYESKGWKVGSSPMVSWRAACATWERRWRTDHPFQGPPTPPSKARTDWENAPDHLREIRWRWAAGERITEEEFAAIANWMDGKEA